MLAATEEETQTVVEYMNWQAPDLKVEFVQKVYVENVLDHQHVVWDVHTDVDRWWVITNPTNLYSQQQFPNMDLALTFHVGICLRVPRSHKPKLGDMPIEPFGECCRYMTEAVDALGQAQEVADFQTIGVRCREALLAFINVVQIAMPWTSTEPMPAKANFKKWAEHMCAVAMGGSTSEYRRHFFRVLLNETWDFANWLTHAKSSRWFDAEVATSAMDHALGYGMMAVIRHLRGVPDTCPACGSHQLSPHRGFKDAEPVVEWEWPTCNKCDWVGEPRPIYKEVKKYVKDERSPTNEEFVLPKVPLWELLRPEKPSIKKGTPKLPRRPTSVLLNEYEQRLFEFLEIVFEENKESSDFGRQAAVDAVQWIISFLDRRGLSGQAMQPLLNVQAALQDVANGIQPELFDPASTTNAGPEGTSKWSRSSGAKQLKHYAAACMSALMTQGTKKMQAAERVARATQSWPTFSAGLIKANTVANWRDELMQSGKTDRDRQIYRHLVDIFSNGPRASEFLAEILQKGPPLTGGLRRKTGKTET
ncbi:MAG: hypothetical protein ABI705_02415 [Aestuariivirga sp.]